MYVCRCRCLQFVGVSAGKCLLLRAVWRARWSVFRPRVSPRVGNLGCTLGKTGSGQFFFIFLSLLTFFEARGECFGVTFVCVYLQTYIICGHEDGPHLGVRPGQPTCYSLNYISFPRICFTPRAANSWKAIIRRLPGSFNKTTINNSLYAHTRYQVRGTAAGRGVCSHFLLQLFFLLNFSSIIIYFTPCFPSR